MCGVRVYNTGATYDDMRIGPITKSMVSSDFSSGKMDGWTVLDTLKNDAELRDIPVVMLTIVDNRNLGFTLGASAIGGSSTRCTTTC